ncbi:MAG: CapA family protein [Chloroflexi bacterium]|nr:CapA family protein [Chloroflexota bacterium]
MGNAAALAALWAGPTSNRDDNKITHVAMTGPAGFSRATAVRMERYGLQYPGEEVAPLLNAVDLAHMSHENPFVPDCPPPEPTGGTTFCAHSRYIELMTYMGIDINEMTGNHLNDWGEHNLQNTFDLFEANGIQTFGGGRDLEQARQPLLIEHNGNRLAFVGCNPVGPWGDWAKEGYGGSLPCDDYTYIHDLISDLDSQGYVVISTLQFIEHFMYEVWAEQRRDFDGLANAGADIVSGSQGHHPQAFNFVNGGFIHYGLGNFMADQMWSIPTRQLFIDIYTIYEGRVLSVQLWTGMIEDYGRPRPMTPEERAELLQLVFTASGWE